MKVFLRGLVVSSTKYAQIKFFMSIKDEDFFLHICHCIRTPNGKPFSLDMELTGHKYISFSPLQMKCFNKYCFLFSVKCGDKLTEAQKKISLTA